MLIRDLLRVDTDCAHLTARGWIVHIARKSTSAEHNWAVVRILDRSASMDVVIFPRLYAAIGDLLHEGHPLQVVGLLTRYEGTNEMHAVDVGPASRRTARLMSDADAALECRQQTEGGWL